jgi:uncharacterized protein (DUF433 family)
MAQVNNTFDRITVEPAKCGGKPCIRGLRITVRRVLELLAAHPHREDLLKEYPLLGRRRPPASAPLRSRYG